MKANQHIEKLKALGVFEAFERNLKSDTLDRTIKEYIDYWERKEPISFFRFISGAFYWEDTSEGHDFWLKIANS